MNAAHAAAGVDKATRACRQCCIHKYAVFADMRVDNIHARQSGNTAYIKLALQRMWAQAAIVVMHLTADDEAQGTAVRCLERRHIRCVCLGHVTAAVDFIVHHHQHALSGAGSVCCCLHSVDDIQRSVGTDCGGRTHCAHKHHRLGALHRQIQKEGRFLHGICAMGDNNAVDILLRKQLITALRQAQQQSIGNTAAVDVAQLLAADMRQLAQFRHTCQQIGNAVGTGSITCHLGAGGSLACNRAAGCQNYNVLQLSFFHQPDLHQSFCQLRS